MSAHKYVRLNLSGYLNSDEYSDVKVRCKDITYKAHRIVLASQIKFFQNLVAERFFPAMDKAWEEGFIPDIIRTIYDSTAPSDRGLRDVIVDIAMVTYKSKDLDCSFAASLTETEGFGSDYRAAMYKKYNTDDMESANAAHLAMHLMRREKGVINLRYKLQRGFLKPNVPVTTAEMDSMSDHLDALERYIDLEPHIINTVKIHKVLRSIIKLDSIPRDEEIRFKQRCKDILESWSKQLQVLKEQTWSSQ